MLISNFIIKRFPNLKSNQPGIEFLARLFFLIILSLVLKKMYWLISDEHGFIKYSFLKGYSPIETLRLTLRDLTAQIISWQGYDPYLYGWVVGIKGAAIVSIQTPCLGINVCLVFAGLVIAFPSVLKLKYKVLFLIIGLLFIQLVNLMRMVAMVFVIKNKYQLPIEHHDLFNLVVYTFIFGMFYWYVNFNSNPSRISNG